MSSDEEHHGDKQPPYIGDESLIVNTRQREIERQRAEEKEYQRAHDSKQRKFNFLLTMFTGLLFLTSVVSDILLWRYVTLTKESADAAKSAAETADATLKQSRASGEETKRQIDRLISEQRRTADSMSKSQRQSKDSMEKSERQSKAALDASITASRTDQRAWVTVEGLELDSPMANGRPRFKITVRNTGKTPALKVDFLTVVSIRLSNGTQHGGTGPDVTPIVSLGPGSPYTGTLQILNKQLLSREEIEDLNAGFGTMLINGEVVYYDIFDDKSVRRTAFCGEYRANAAPALVSCTGFDYTMN